MFVVMLYTISLTRVGSLSYQDISSLPQQVHLLLRIVALVCTLSFSLCCKLLEMRKLLFVVITIPCSFVSSPYTWGHQSPVRKKNGIAFA